jgi:hypothetical protein
MLNSRLNRNGGGESKMANRLVVTALLASAVTASAFVLNPTHEQHREQIRQSVTDHNALAGVLGFGTLKALATSYHSFGVVSWTTMGKHTVSVGALGMVFIVEHAE